MKRFLLVLLLLQGIGATAHDFYTNRYIPAFTDSEQRVIDKYNIHFIQFTKESSVDKHNKQVLALIAQHGAEWYTQLSKEIGWGQTAGCEFINNLLSGGEIVSGDEEPRLFIEYYDNGIISSWEQLTDRIGNSSAAYFELNAIEKTWDEKGKYQGKRKYVKSGSTCCFAADTKIQMADGCKKDICLLKKGDAVITFNPDKNCTETALIENMISVKHRNVVEYDFGAFKITATADHPFYLEGKRWASLQPNTNLADVKADDIKQIAVGDIFYLYENGALQKIKLLGIKQLDGEVDTYTITALSNGNIFFANGVAAGVEFIDPIIAALFLH